MLFSHPQTSRLAVEQGLRLGQDAETMQERLGEVMGLFAYGHPFLDCNGRTMLLVHSELCHRAGFSIRWSETNKKDYLAALTEEIDHPGKGVLDSYLNQFKSSIVKRSSWENIILSINGLSGLDNQTIVKGDLSDPEVAQMYREQEEKRDYHYGAQESLDSDDPEDDHNDGVGPSF